MDPTPRPEDLVGEPVPDLALVDTSGSPFRIRQFVGRCPLVLFFVVRSGTPG
jgi:peroxiredoxin